MNTEGRDESDQVLSSGARALIRDHIRSIEQLDLLMWLQQRSSDDHELDGVAEALGIGPSVARAAVAHLSRHQALTVTADRTVRVRYAPQSSRFDRTAAQLAESYESSRVHALTFISTCAIERESLAQQGLVVPDPSAGRTAKRSK